MAGIALLVCSCQSDQPSCKACHSQTEKSEPEQQQAPVAEPVAEKRDGEEASPSEQPIALLEESPVALIEQAEATAPVIAVETPVVSIEAELVADGSEVIANSAEQ